VKSSISRASRFDFGTLADSYDSWYSSPAGAMYDRLEKKAVLRFLPHDGKGRSILEIGCGTGHWSAIFSRLGYQVIGIDISLNMLRKAKEKHIDNLRLVAADAHNLPFPDGRFDVVTALTTLEFVSRPEEAFREMARCTRKPGGRIILGVLNRLSRLNQQRKRKKTGTYRDAKFYSPDELREMLRVYGKSRISVSTFTPRRSSLLWLAPLYDRVARILRYKRGDFIAAVVNL